MQKFFKPIEEDNYGSVAVCKLFLNFFDNTFYIEINNPNELCYTIDDYPRHYV